MKDRKIMIEVTEEEYEMIKKGIKLSDMKTEDIVYELISRSDTRDYIKGPGSVLTGDVDIIGSIRIPEEGVFKFQFFKAKKIVRPSFSPIGTFETDFLKSLIGKSVKIELPENSPLKDKSE